ncbi:patatin-like phospholipase family protein [Magnetospirillum sp. UT-4]|uniref:patatin-like phospholipase family protein n=1 Tax=Magnetospirillum sp. UT-4 TaxID=2681467 RepID=UPI00137FDE82|nr:patatin-like phospholipase family protein [Magnetospirillum sp. UT-4]CAA7626129.1 Patatin [Magnetospirillum sp. UT-4]
MPLDPAAPDHGGQKAVTLALQGGGAHGAFTWGVLEGLLKDGRVRIEGLSGTSAGALNAAVLVDGFIRGGTDGAVTALREFWRRISSTGLQSLFSASPWGRLDGGWNLDETGAYALFDMVTRMFSPYELNPLDINPLRDVVEDSIDFEAVRHCDSIRLFITATNVKTCKPRIFHNREITAKVLMASACVPLLFRAVEIDGEHFWDGGYMGNPSISPLIGECGASDVVIVQINPLVRAEVPTKARDILNRITELSFNSSLVREMRGFATITGLIEAGKLKDDRYKPVNFHMIEAGGDLPALGVSSKFNTDWRFLEHLHELGIDAAQRWLAANYDALGSRSSLDVFEAFV